jgi:hypothetical protein
MAGERRGKRQPAANEADENANESAGPLALNTMLKKTAAAIGALVGVCAGIAVFTAPFVRTGPALISITLAALAALTLAGVAFAVLYTCRKKKITVPLIAIMGFLILVLAAGAGAGYIVHRLSVTGNPRPLPLVTVQVAGSSTFFDDPAVRAELRRQGIVLEETSAGSRQVCAEPSLAARYDVANSGSQDSASCVVQKLTAAGLNPHKSNPFSSPMVILTYDPIVALLKTLGVVKQANGITIFDVREYLDVVKAGTQWASIKGNLTYLNRSRILLGTTDPRFSNSGGMFATIAYSAQTKDNHPPTDPQPGDSRVALIRECFSEQGSMDTHTPDLIRQFITDGMDAYPMVMAYEDDYIQALLSGLAGPKSGITVMYPNPDVISDNTLVSWTPHGNMMTALLTKPAMAAAEEQHGYRTSGDSSGFVSYMAARGITVPNLNALHTSLQFAGLPTDTSLQELINEVVPG